MFVDIIATVQFGVVGTYRSDITEITNSRLRLKYPKRNEKYITSRRIITIPFVMVGSTAGDGLRSW